MVKPATVVTIGSTEFLDFPELGLKKVPAKVDTGADSSAIWASNIQLKDGALHFELFGKSSPYYTGEVVKASRFTKSRIKNSFGHTELRYKVPLTVVIAGRTIKARFTLADRADNQFPILIGRRTLRGKFLVDVSRTTARTKFEVLVLASRHPKTVHKFFDAITAPKGVDLRFTTATYDDLVFELGGTESRVSAFGRNIANYDLIYFKTFVKHSELASAVAKYAHKRRVPCVDRTVLQYPASTKLQQYMILHDNGVDIPKSVLYAPQALAAHYDDLVSALGIPFVLKDIAANKGENNFLIHNQSEFNAATKQAVNNDLRLIAQAYLVNDGDYRVLVLAGEVQLIIRRQGQKGSYLNNVSTGGKAELVSKRNIPADVRAIACKAADLLQLDVAGVDMLHDKTSGSWYCLEVNDSPQIASGAFVPEKVAAFEAFIHQTLTNK